MSHHELRALSSGLNGCCQPEHNQRRTNLGHPVSIRGSNWSGNCCCKNWNITNALITGRFVPGATKTWGSFEEAVSLTERFDGQDVAGSSAHCVDGFRISTSNSHSFELISP
jgi:hypothetical protein